MESGDWVLRGTYGRTSVQRALWPADGAVTRVRGIGGRDEKGKRFLHDAIFVD